MLAVDTGLVEEWLSEFKVIITHHQTLNLWYLNCCWSRMQECVTFVENEDD